MIKFADYQHKYQRRHIISFCTNCHEISGSQFINCPKCKGKIIKKQIQFYINNADETRYPVINLTKSELVNQFVPSGQVNKLTEEQMIKISEWMELFIKERLDDKIYNIIRNRVEILTKNIL